jgi:hypothetical protein
MASHVVTYDENDAGTQSWAKCSCGEKSSRRPGPAAKNTAALDRWADTHIDQNT